ncbi:MAG: glycoside hydrolase family 10 protein, partial [Cyanobacteriota bacterium]
MAMKQIVSSAFNASADALVRFSRAFGRQTWFLFLLLFTFSLTVLTPSVSLSQSTRLNDIEGHWARLCIQELAQRDIISGYPDGTFRPNIPVTRAEFAALLKNAFPNAPITRDSVGFGVEFADVSDEYWAVVPVRWAFQRGFMSGYPDGTFAPQQNITRVEVLLSLVSGLNYTPTQPVNQTLTRSYQDAAAIPNFAEDVVAAATENELVVNYPNVQQLNPNQAATRGEVAAFLCQGIGNEGAIPPQYVAHSNGQQTQAQNELRGVWLTNIDSDVLFSRDRLNNALTSLAQLNFNTVYPTVWNWGYTLYPSSVAEKVIGTNLDPEPGLQGRDMLQEVINLGHEKGLSVVPWFEFGFMAPSDSALAKRHSDWLTQRRDASTTWMEGTHERVWLNPFHPEVQKFIQDLVVEIARNYDIDGIQFDDHLGLPSEFGYDDFTVALYQTEHGGKFPPNNPKDPEWIRWRADKITNFMNQLFTAIKAVKPNAVVALSPNPQEFAYDFYLQDWHRWERQGFIEELIVQVYRENMDDFLRELNHSSLQMAQGHIPVGIGVLAGLKG